MSIARSDRADSALWQRPSVRTAAAALSVLAAAAVLAGKWPLIDSGAGRLGSADRGWLTVAALAGVMTWVCSAVAQQGAVVRSLPPGRLLAAQFAACAANHVLPANVGGNAVNLRFLIRRGLTPTHAVAALTVRACASAAGRTVLLLTALAAFPGALHIRRAASRTAVPGHPLVVAVAATAVLAGCVVLVRCARRLRDRLRNFASSVAADVRALHHDRARIAALWGGSLAFPVMHAAVLASVVRAVHASVPLGGAVVAYLCASTATGWMPSPAGLGSLDAALALALVSAGASAVAATSVVLGYRLFTAWLPLLPGIAVLAVMVRCREL